MGGGAWGFPDTVWALVLKAKDSSAKEYKQCLDQLISMYWKPVYRYIRIAWRKSNEDAKDLTQDFFSHFLEKEYLKPVDPQKGRFRTYVKVALKHFLINMKEKSQAQKRGGDTFTMSFDDVNDDPCRDDNSDPVGLFDKEWARMVISRSIKLLRDRLIDEGKDKYFNVFEMYYICRDSAGASSKYGDISTKLKVKETDVRNYLTYSRRVLKDIVRNEIKQYVIDESDIDDELKYLMSIQF